MTDRDILIELLAIKLFEHTPLASGEINRLSWTKQALEDRAAIRDLILAHRTAEGLLAEYSEP